VLTTKNPFPEIDRSVAESVEIGNPCCATFCVGIAMTLAEEGSPVPPADANSVENWVDAVL